MLPRLRNTLDFMPSPWKDKPGLLIRDPYQYSDATLLVPTRMAPCLAFFDGEKSLLDLRAYLIELTGQPEVTRLEEHFIDSLSKGGFLEDEAFATMKADAERKFAEAPVRLPQHAGSGYPDDPAELRTTFQQYMTGKNSDSPDTLSGKTIAIAAPHVSPFGGIDAYRAAYSALTPEDADRTFVILGTSHYGAPDRFGLTRKPFATPLGETVPDLELVNELERGGRRGVLMEDYCHSMEHSIEFQVVFLQHLFGPKIRVVPILCGPFLQSMLEGGMPEATDEVQRTLGTLGEIAAREGSRLAWVLGVDMAHMGNRYHDSFDVLAGEGVMQEVEQRDRARIGRMAAGDAQGFWERIQENRDDLKWCGASPIYTFLKAVPEARGELRHYQQWNIDEASVVSFAGMRFTV
jgi:hypothetical protein